MLSGYLTLIKIVGIRSQSEYVIAHGFNDVSSLYLDALTRKQPTICLHECLPISDYFTVMHANKLRLKYRNVVSVTTDDGLQLEA